ncbi:MAG: cyclic nucleotide-binding domain-containing protein [Actinobacteria bacterium]|nr:cyclic nucleotide-binding domain-containing protein [Actinomycetota bacterium]
MNPADILAQVPYFAALPAQEIERLGSICNIVDTPQGTVVIEEGAAPGDLFVVLEGTFRAARKGASGDLVLGTSSVGEVIGEMSLLEGRPTSAQVVAQTPGKLLRIPGTEIETLMASPEVSMRMLRTVTTRLRERETALVQAEKLAALGTMTAGLLHEVNNPAAALINAGSRLEEAVGRLVPSAGAVTLSPLQRSDRVRALARLLTSSGVDSKLAGSLVAQGWDEEKFGATPEAERQKVAELAQIRQLTSEMLLAATRLSELVGTVKRWTFHDQGERNDVDLVTVVLDSLTLLRHKSSSLRVSTKLPDTLTVEAQGGELSQVVTNLIDNAIDAASQKITIELGEDSGQATLVVEDDGPGIPSEKANKIWEPFFTTKAPGKGSGLGLAISQRIVNDHGGSLTLDSQPGRTRFVLRLRKKLAP